MPTPAKNAPKRNMLVSAIGIAWTPFEWLGREAVVPALEKLIPQGASELANALFQGHAYMPYGATSKPVPKAKKTAEHGVHGPPKTLEEKAADAVAFEEAKSAQRKEREIEKEVSTMSPEEQTIAERFRSVATPSTPDFDLER
jgi:hypothetical protein